ncbi:Rieske (2Fe-2S) protein [Roseomonas sp. NAR14]|uniref:Rieske (2Fe-2S) protein n=1 Tax=Roseomonas acroporae TaxID=2937791 RepID=A0A9X1Y5P6_9PROT|nr:Rieske (2Fe-2S) protein [Roseomonas acroporae]MCK8783966.1 Rieske (2Fe-2S) protein [Roseomonas acroporae]
MPGDTLTREHVLGNVDEIPVGEGRNFEVAGRTVAVFRNHAGEVFASQADCPHLGGPLADGMLGGSTIMCPLHDRMFDLRTGSVLVGECGITVYPIRKAEDGTLLLSLDG